MKWQTVYLENTGANQDVVCSKFYPACWALNYLKAVCMRRHSLFYEKNVVCWNFYRACIIKKSPALQIVFVVLLSVVLCRRIEKSKTKRVSFCIYMYIYDHFFTLYMLYANYKTCFSRHFHQNHYKFRCGQTNTLEHHVIHVTEPV